MLPLYPLPLFVTSTLSRAPVAAVDMTAAKPLPPSEPVAVKEASGHITDGGLSEEYPAPPFVTRTVVILPVADVQVAAAPEPVHGGSQMKIASPLT
jgi:hypothetical protein